MDMENLEMPLLFSEEEDVSQVIGEIFEKAEKKSSKPLLGNIWTQQPAITSGEMAQEGMHIVTIRPLRLYELLPGRCPEEKLWLFLIYTDWKVKDMATAMDISTSTVDNRIAYYRTCIPTDELPRRYDRLPGANPKGKLWLFFVNTKWVKKEIAEAIDMSVRTVYRRLALYT